jgi:hypothetical protein
LTEHDRADAPIVTSAAFVTDTRAALFASQPELLRSAGVIATARPTILIVPDLSISTTASMPAARAALIARLTSDCLKFESRGLRGVGFDFCGLAALFF